MNVRTTALGRIAQDLRRFRFAPQGCGGTTPAYTESLGRRRGLVY